MGGVIRLEDLRAAWMAGDAEPLCRGFHEGRLMPQRLQQPVDAMAAFRRAEQHGADLALAQILGQIVEHTVARRLDVAEKLLHQLVVVIRQLLQHGKTGLLLTLGQFGGHVDDFTGRVLAVDEGPLQRQIDEAGCDAVLPDGDLPQHQGQAAGRLEHRQDVADRGFRFVDFVEEQEMRDAAIFQVLHDKLQGRHLLLVRLADHDRCIANGKRRLAILLELDRPGAIDEGEVIAEKGDVGEIGLDGHCVLARFGRSIAGCRAGRDRALPLGCASSRKNSLK